VLLLALTISAGKAASANDPDGFKEPTPREIVAAPFTDREIERLITTLDVLLAKQKNPSRWGADAANHLWTFVERLQAGRLTPMQEARVAAHLDFIGRHHPADAATIQKERRVLTTLTVGKVAPDITGKDLDGKVFNLSEYRGRVVVLTFSGEWCGACRSEYPYQRLLLELYKDRPFAIVGVNSDSDAAAARKAKADRGLTYRSWWDGSGPKNTRGPIATAWGVIGWPTIYVLDEDGVIRFVNLRQEDLLKAVKQLVNEQATKAAKPDAAGR
jgi:peroxiredoxin